MPDKKLSEHQLRRLLEVGMVLASELELEAVLDRVVEAAADLAGARYAAVGLLDMSKTSIDLEHFRSLGIGEETRERIGSPPEGLGVLGELVRDPVPLRLDRIADHRNSYGFPEGHPVMETFLGVPILLRGEPLGNIYVTEKSGAGGFDELDEMMLVNLAEWTAIAIANCSTLRESTARRTELERLVQGLEANVSVSRMGPTEVGSRSLVESVAKRARALVECRSLLILAPGSAEGLTVSAVAGEALAETGQTIFPDRDALDNARRDGLVNRLEGVVFRTSDGKATDSSSSLMISLDHGPTSVGYVLAIGPIGREIFELDDELLLQSFAGSAANSLAVTRVAEQSSRRMAIKASELERRRWAMELHDETLQDLGALKVMLEGALVLGDQKVSKRSLKASVSQLDNTIVSLESLIQELRPATLDALGVAAAVETLIERMNNRSLLGATLHTDLAFERGDASDRLDPQLEATIYRVIQESLNNVAKHAGATRTTVSIVETGSEITIFIEDDGKGFLAADGFGSRFGLNGMRERVEVSAGTLDIDSAPGKGTRVEIHLPGDGKSFAAPA